jgi:hypothetical protein
VCKLIVVTATRTDIVRTDKVYDTWIMTITLIVSDLIFVNFQIVIGHVN